MRVFFEGTALGIKEGAILGEDEGDNVGLTVGANDTVGV